MDITTFLITMTESTVVESLPEPGAARLRLLFCTRAAFGHLYPLMPLACAARDAGHDIVFATSESFLPRIRALGFETHRVGISIEEAEQEVLSARSGPPGDGSRPDFDLIGQVFLGLLAPRTADDLLPLLNRLGPDLVIYEQVDFGAAVAAALLEVPAICHSLARAFGAEMRQLFAGTRLDALWAHYGMVSAPLDVFRGDAYLDIYPPSLQEPSIFEEPRRIPMRPVPWSEPTGAMPAWVRTRSRPLVYLTLGTVPFRDGDGLRAAAEGLSTLGVDVLVALGPHDPSVLGSVPAGVHVEHFVRQADVLPYVDLVVHHGGSGTLIGALSKGLPQLILPQGADQFINADMVVSTGLGLSLGPDSVSPDAVIEAARSLLTDSSYRDAARPICREIAAMPHPTDVLPTLVQRALAQTTGRVSRSSS
jgi:UDP:flavonoid glycosyltransferase YjiC (YdhE family)